MSRCAGTGHGGSLGSAATQTLRDRDVRHAMPSLPADLRQRVGQGSQLRAARRPQRPVPELLRRLDALHARAAGDCTPVATTSCTAPGDRWSRSTTPCPSILEANGVHTHLVTDHYHYWEDGGATYHTRYTTWDIARGQEGDTWIGDVAEPAHRIRRRTLARTAGAQVPRQDRVNRAAHDQRGAASRRHAPSTWAWTSSSATTTPTTGSCRSRPSTRTSRSSRQQEFKDLYPHEYDGPPFDWPPLSAR